MLLRLGITFLEHKMEASEIHINTPTLSLRRRKFNSLKNTSTRSFLPPLHERALTPKQLKKTPRVLCHKGLSRIVLLVSTKYNNQIKYLIKIFQKSVLLQLDWKPLNQTKILNTNNYITKISHKRIFKKICEPLYNRTQI